MDCKRRIACLLLLACAATARAEVRDASGLVYVATDAPTDSVTVGQRFPVRYRLTAPDSLAFVARDGLDAGRCRVVSLAWHESPAEGAVERVADVVMVAAALDSVAVPPVSFDFVAPAGDTLRAWSEGFEVPIRRIALASKDVRPLKSQWEVPPDYAKWVAIGLAALALAALAVWYVRKRRARVVASLPEVKLPPDYVALAELERIAGMQLVERGEFKPYYTLVADVVRRYLGERFSVEAMDRTTHELLDDLTRRDVVVAGLGSLLEEADLVKFAKFQPDRARAQRALDEARSIVIATTPRAEPSTQATGTEA